jgi:hypothetical protein
MRAQCNPFADASAVYHRGARIAGVGQALALSPLPVDAAVIIPIQDEENKELWQDLRPDETPPQAAVGNEGQAPYRLADVR